MFNIWNGKKCFVFGDFFSIISMMLAVTPCLSFFLCISIIYDYMIFICLYLSSIIKTCSLKFFILLLFFWRICTSFCFYFVNAYVHHLPQLIFRRQDKLVVGEKIYISTNMHNYEGKNKINFMEISFHKREWKRETEGY